MRINNWKRNLPLHIMLLPGIVFVILFSYIPMLGIIIAFQKFIPNRGFFNSPWVGLENFKFILQLPNIYEVIRNTLLISSFKVAFGLLVPIIIALMLNEVNNVFIKRGIQTLIYLPHFLSWVILGGILIDVLSTNGGMVNQILSLFGIQPIFFLGDNKWFPFTLVSTDVWKEFGFSSVVYLAAITSIEPTLYEAAYADGANRIKQTIHVTIPEMAPIIILMALLSIGNILNAGFEQVFNLYSPQVYQSGDIIDTMVYRIGLVDAQYGLATAVGIFKSAVSLILISVSYKLADKLANYRIF